MPATKKSSPTRAASPKKAAAARKPPAVKAIKPAEKKATAGKAAKAPARKPVAKKAVSAKPAARKPAGKKPAEAGRRIESFIAKRDIKLPSVEEALGIKRETRSENRPVIPGKFDLLIPPGVPRKMIIELAKEYDLEIVQRNDSYVPIGISDIKRELLAIRGDEKTVKKMEKILLKRLEEFTA